LSATVDRWLCFSELNDGRAIGPGSNGQSVTAASDQKLVSMTPGAAALKSGQFAGRHAKNAPDRLLFLLDGGV
jgi:hypothetical protein